MSRRHKELLTPHLFFVGACAAAAISSSVVPAGRQLRARVDATVRVAEGRKVTATLVDPVYVRDRVVIPAGSVIAGRVETVKRARGWSRVWALTGGDLTPREALTMRFDTLALPNGRRVRIVSTAASRADDVELRLPWWRDYLLGQLPVHRRYVHAGAVLTVRLVEAAAISHQSSVVGHQSSVVSHQSSVDAGRSGVPARLITSIDSRTAARGDVVRLALLAPIVADDGRVLAAEGDVILATVADVRRARWLGRSGRVALQVGAATHLERGAGLSNVRFVWPPLAVLALLGARTPDAPDAANVFGRGGAGWSGFELVGAAIAQASTPAAVGFGVWGLARATWVNVLAKGRDVALSAGSIVLLDPSVP